MSQHPERPPHVAPSSPRRCHCSALREAARYVTLLYDRHLAAAGLRSTQFSLLSRLKELGPTAINTRAQALAMDRTTIRRTIPPHKSRDLMGVKRGERDARQQDQHCMPAGSD